MDDATAIAQADSQQDQPLVRVLTLPQRRVIGVLVEKGFTTPEYYPLTLKAVTTGCNQKSNRDPVSNYSEDAVEETLDQLRELGLVAVVHTESGRTERFRHFVRKRFPFTEPQLAILTELLLRGRQQLGELRSRASRMVTIGNVDELRDNLKQLAEGGWIRASGPLERRGIEVDHTFYAEGEAPAFEASVYASEYGSDAEAPTSRTVNASSQEITELREQVEALRTQVDQLALEVGNLRESLGG